MTTGVVVDFNAQLSRFTSGVDKAINDLNKFQSHADRISKNITSAFGALGVGLSVGGVVAYGKAIVDLGDEMNDLSQRVGINIKDLATWQLAASQSGTTMESVAKGVKGLSVFIVENGDALKKAGINATDANGAMIQLADLFKDMPDGVEKTALAVKIFGKAGMDMIPMLNLGSEGLREAQEKAKSYGERLAELAPKADAFNDQMEELALQSKAAGMNITDYLLPGLTGLAIWFNDLAAGGDRAATALEFLSEKSPLFSALVKFNKMVNGGEGKAVGYKGPKTPQGLPASLEDQFSAATDAYMADAPARAKANEAKRIACTINGGRWNASTGTCEMQKPGAGGKAGKKIKAELMLPGANNFGEEVTLNALIADQKAADALEAKAKAMDELHMARMEMYRIETEGEEAVRIALEKSAKTMDEMTQFTIEAARNMQDAMADGFFDIMQGKFDNLGDQFKATIDRMVANAMAANLGSYLLGDFGKTGNLGGAVGKFLGAGSGPEQLSGPGAGDGIFDKLLSFLPKFDVGTPYVPRDMPAMLHKGERVMTAAENAAGGSGMTNVFNFTLQAPADRRTQEQVAAMAGAGIQRAMARNR